MSKGSEAVRFSVWRHYAPATLVSYANNSAIPARLLPDVIALLGQDSLGALTREIRKHQRHGLPRRIQSSIKKLFCVYRCESASARALALRDLKIACDGRQRSIPFPFAICAPIKVRSFVVQDFGISRDPKKRTISIWGRYGIATNQFLKPKNKSHVGICRLIATGTLCEADLSPEDSKTVIKWLSLNGFSKAKAVQAAADEGFRNDLYFQLLDRLEEFVGLNGAEVLSPDGEPLVLEAEEEKGYS